MTDETGAAAPVVEQAVTAPAAAEQAPTETVRDLDAVPEVAAETKPPETETPAPEGDADSTEEPKRLTRNQRLQRKAARLSTMLAEQATELDRLRQATAKTDTDSEPKEADYSGDWTKYQADYAAWKATKSIKGVLEEREQRERAAQVQQRTNEATEDFLERVEEVKTRLPDFDKVMHTFEKDGGKFASHVIEEIRDSDKGPLLAYQLAQTPELVAQLNAMSPRDAAREIGRLEAKASLPQPKKQTQAPAPLTSVKGGASKPVTVHDDLPMDDYVKLRKAQG